MQFPFKYLSNLRINTALLTHLKSKRASHYEVFYMPLILDFNHAALIQLYTSLCQKYVYAIGESMWSS